MRRTALLALLLVIPLETRADCSTNPLLSTFQVITTCDYATPCAEEQPLQLKVEAQRGCYPRWAPCAPFPFAACDRIEWDFGDGTKATSNGTGAITHTWANPGTYHVQGVVSNRSGSKGFGTTMIVVRKPIVRVHWSAPTYTANETDGEVTLTLQREGDPSRAVTVSLIAGLGAYPGDAWDRNLEHVFERPITIPAGATSVPVTLKILDDDIYRGEHRYDVFVSDRSGETILPLASTVAGTEVRLLDDETGPEVAVSDITVTEGDAERRMIKIPHVLSAPLADDLILSWEPVDGTATRTVDWDTFNGAHYINSAIIPAGATRADLELQILGDVQAESDKTLVLTVRKSYGPGVTFSQPRITVTIVDDDVYRLTSGESRADVGMPFAMRITTTRPQPAPVTAMLASSDPSIVAVPPSVTLAANATEVAFTAQTLRAGDATITATFPNEKSVSAELLVVQHTALEFARETARVAVDAESHITLAATPAAPIIVSLRATPAGVIDLPPLVELDAGGNGTFAIRGMRAGAATIIATLPEQFGSTSERIVVTVEPSLTPSIAKVTPSFGSAAGGTSVTIGGTDFSLGCAVMFGGVPATSAWKDEETLTAVAPPHVAGMVDVMVQCGESVTTLANAFTYTPAKRRAVR